VKWLNSIQRVPTKCNIFDFVISTSIHRFDTNQSHKNIHAPHTHFQHTGHHF
jgi:hypothetical protein